MQRLDDLIKRITEYRPRAEPDLIRKAYVYATKVHKGQIRKSGEAYIVHPFEVASILAELHQDLPTIAAGFLHDTVEDTLVTLKDIEDLFGPDVAFLVDGVTKIGKIHFSSRAENQAENFRKMLVAMANDIRVILIKLADRTHNMRTLNHLSVAKQEEISQETQEIYAPLANRLGIHWMRSELEDLALSYLKPHIYQKLEKELRRFKKAKSNFIETVAKIIQEKLENFGVEVKVSGRLKHIAGIYRKMETRNLVFEEVNDIIAFRIVVDEVSECYEALGLIHALWKPVPGRFKDYIAMPKENLYQSLHTTVIGPEGERIEIQIRTQEMHRIAEEGIAAHWQYKEDGTVDEKTALRFRWLRQLMEWQQELKDPSEFMASVKEGLFDENVYVFTPKGDVRPFPRGATPIDFAYGVHSAVGNQCVGAKVNGRIVPLKYELKSGDTVEILTNKNSHPSKDWINLAKTSRAKNRIRGFVKREERAKSMEVGRDMLDAELKRFDLSLSKVEKHNGLDDFIRKQNQGNIENMLTNVALGNLPIRQVVNALVPQEKLAHPQEERAEGTLEKIFRRVGRSGKNSIRVGGQEDVLTIFALCCNPLPGDDIIGYVTRGRGVTIHAAECPMILGGDEDRRITVEWDDHPKKGNMAKIRTVSIDKPGMLAQMSRAITLSGVNIAEAICRSNAEAKAVNIFTLNVEDLGQLRKVIQRLEDIDGVISVERLRNEAV